MSKLKESSTSEVKLIELSAYQRPKIEINKSKDWVLNGKNNCFYDILIKRNNGSVTHNAINQQYATLIYGGGLTANVIDSIDQWTKLKTILKPSDLRKVVIDQQLFNEHAFLCVWGKGKKTLASVKHIDKSQVVPQIENDKGEIEGYWYCKDWSNTSKYEPIYYPILGTSSKNVEIYVNSPYSAGSEYFATPDYLPALAWAEMEEEIANLCVNTIRNGLTAGYIINVPDGQVLAPEEKERLEKDIKKHLTRSENAGRFIINFAAQDKKIEVEVFPVADNIHKQWEFLTGESKQQIITAHRLTSPMLLGIKEATGLGNNADEMKTAEEQLMKYVIRPKQDLILDSLYEIFMYCGISLDIKFAPLHSESTTVELSNQKKKSVADELINLGEDEDDNFDLICAFEDDGSEEFNLARDFSSFPNAKSEQDTSIFKIRYAYAPNRVSDNSREFCRKMVSAGKVYRIEDIILAGNKVVNPGWGPRGADTYDLLKYKGGGDCHHYWERRIYLRKNNKKISVTEAQTMLRNMGVDERKNARWATNDKDVAKLPTDMPNNGFLEPRR